MNLDQHSYCEMRVTYVVPNIKVTEPQTQTPKWTWPHSITSLGCEGCAQAMLKPGLSYVSVWLRVDIDQVQISLHVCVCVCVLCVYVHNVGAHVCVCTCVCVVECSWVGAVPSLTGEWDWVQSTSLPDPLAFPSFALREEKACQLSTLAVEVEVLGKGESERAQRRGTARGSGQGGGGWRGGSGWSVWLHKDMEFGN